MMDFDELEELEVEHGMASPQDGGAQPLPPAAAGAVAAEVAVPAPPPPAAEAAEARSRAGALRGAPVAAGPAVALAWAAHRDAGGGAGEEAGAAEAVRHSLDEPPSEPEAAPADDGVAPSEEAVSLPEETGGERPAVSLGEDPAAGTCAEQGPAIGANQSYPDIKPKGVEEDSTISAALPAVVSSSAQAWQRVDTRCAEIPVVKAVAESLNVTPAIVAIVGSFCAVSFLLYGFGGQLLCTALGFLYPAFESFKAAEGCHVSVMQFWLMYWVVWALFCTAECLCYYIVIWIPFYYPLKLAALVWLFHPATKGARFVYRWLVSPVMLKNQEKIDAALEESSQQIKKGVSGALSSAVGVGLHTAMAAGAGALPRVKSLSGLALEVLLARRMPSPVEDDASK